MVKVLNGIKQITCKEAQKFINNKTALLLDVRPKVHLFIIMKHLSISNVLTTDMLPMQRTFRCHSSTKIHLKL